MSARAIDGFEIVPHKAVCHFAVDHACTSNATKEHKKQNKLSARVCECLLEMWIVIEDVMNCNMSLELREAAV